MRAPLVESKLAAGGSACLESGAADPVRPRDRRRRAGVGVRAGVHAPGAGSRPLLVRHRLAARRRALRSGGRAQPLRRSPAPRRRGAGRSAVVDRSDRPDRDRARLRRGPVGSALRRADLRGELAAVGRPDPRGDLGRRRLHARPRDRTLVDPVTPLRAREPPVRGRHFGRRPRRAPRRPGLRDWQGSRVDRDVCSSTISAGSEG